LSNYLGNLVEHGEYPESDLPYLKKVIKDICYNNSLEYFGY
ncbi:MAG: glucuronate isomerase, partial [Clostridia bacterium]|nr:glucuronate isomerase [Clostridia bacterium]